MKKILQILPLTLINFFYSNADITIALENKTQDILYLFPCKAFLIPGERTIATNDKKIDIYKYKEQDQSAKLKGTYEIPKDCSFVGIETEGTKYKLKEIHPNARKAITPQKLKALTISLQNKKKDLKSSQSLSFSKTKLGLALGVATLSIPLIWYCYKKYSK